MTARVHAHYLGNEIDIPGGVRLDLLDAARDLDRCVQMERRLFVGEDPWSLSAFQSELRQGHLYVGAYSTAASVPDEALIGYAGLAIGAMLRPDAEVHTIAVDPEHQGRGIGRALLRALLAHADERSATTFLEVRTDNEPALELYRRHGFHVVGLRKRYYQPSGADAHTMRRWPDGAAEGERP